MPAATWYPSAFRRPLPAAPITAAFCRAAANVLNRANITNQSLPAAANASRPVPSPAKVIFHKIRHNAWRPVRITAAFQPVVAAALNRANITTASRPPAANVSSPASMIPAFPAVVRTVNLAAHLPAAATP